MKTAKLLTLAKLFILILLCLSTCGTASAGPTGAEVLDKCKNLVDKGSVFEGGYCAGFMDGVIDTARAWENSDEELKRKHEPWVRFCLPKEVTNGQIARVFVKFLEDHPEKLHFPANLLFIEALRTAFPCKV
jgi:hypothetical protein